MHRRSANRGCGEPVIDTPHALAIVCGMSNPLRTGTLPWTRSCFVCGEDNPCGLHLRARLEDGRIVLTYTPRDADLGWRGWVHGGITMTLLDEVMTWAAILASRRACVAAEVGVRFRHPIRVGEPVQVEGRVRGHPGRIIATEGRVTDTAGRTLAMATGKYLPMPHDEAAACAADFVSHPDAISPEELIPPAAGHKM